MIMDLKQLVQFCHVCHHTTLSDAARELYLTPQAISKMIKSLEHELNIKLIQTTTAGFHLTNEGEQLWRQLQPFADSCDQMEQIFNAMKQTEHLNLKIAVATDVLSQFPLDMLANFNRLYPNISLSIQEEYETVCEEMVAAGNTDLALTILPVDEELFHVTKLFRVPLYIAAPENHLITKKPLLHLKELETQPLITMDERHRSYQLFCRLCREQNITPKIMQKVSSISSMFYFISNGIGLGFSTEYHIPALTRLKIKAIPLVPDEFSWEIGIVQKRDNYEKKAAKIFTNFLQTCIDKYRTQ